MTHWSIGLSSVVKAFFIVPDEIGHAELMALYEEGKEIGKVVQHNGELLSLFWVERKHSPHFCGSYFLLQIM